MKNNSTQIDTVVLDFYMQEYKAELENYFLPIDQLKYSGMPLDAIEKCEIEEDRYPIVILNNNKPAGFFVLHGWEGVRHYSDNKDAILLRAYSVNASCQGKGIAKKSLLLLPSFVKKHFPTKNEIILCVNHKNIAAQNVYLKSGFKDQGIRVMGSIGEMFLFHMDV